MSRISNKWLEQMPAMTVKGNNSGTIDDVKDLSVSELLNMIGLSNPCTYPKYKILSGIGVDVGAYEQYVIHNKNKLVIDGGGSLSVATGGEIIIK